MQVGGLVVATFDDVEYERWMQTAWEHLRVAGHNAAGGFFSAAVLQAEQATHCALRALLHGVGQPLAAPGHGLLSLADACRQWAGLVLDDDARDSLARLAREYLPTRYPDALPEGTPMTHYGRRDAEWAASAASQTMTAVATAWGALLGQSDGGAL